MKGTQNFYVTGKSITDPSRNVYQVGSTLNDDGDYDALITKYDQNGNALWAINIDNGSGGDETLIDVDYMSSGRIIATGVSRSSTGDSAELLTIQINANGTIKWSDFYSYPGSVYNIGASVTIDGSDNAYVTGATYNTTTLSDAITLKYDHSGNIVWIKTSDYSNGLFDAAVKIKVSGTKVDITGGSQSGATSWRYLAITYDATNGNMINSFVSIGGSTSLDQLKDMATDESGNIYVTGTSGTTNGVSNIYTLKLDDELNVIWDETYSFSGIGFDVGYSICIDNSNNVIITGTSTVGAGNTQFTTLKYNSAGTTLWVKNYDISDGLDSAKVVTTDDSGNIYVSGTFDNGSNQDVKTIKYDSNGNQIWEIDYNGIFNGQEYLLDITHDGESVVVTTQTEIESGLFRYATLKYNEIDYESPVYPNETTVFANGFIKNSGQLRSENEAPAYAVKYYSKTGDYQGFYKDDRFEFMTRTFHNDTTINDSAQKVVFAFTDAEPYLKPRPMNKSEYFENYYFHHFPGKLERVAVYERMFYPKIWQDIALETYFGKSQEFSFTIGTKGAISNIKIDVSGADSLIKNTSGELGVYTFNSAILLGRPRAYQKNGSGDLVELSWLPAFKLVGNQIRLDSIGAYNTQEDLIIRINRGVQDVPETEGFCHSTYIGSPQVTVSDGVTDNNGKPIFCGISSSSIFYLELSNSVWIGNESLPNSGFITKLNRDMVPQFSTFLFVDGGDGYSEIWLHALAVDNENNIFSAGQVWANWAPTQNSIGAAYYEPSPLGGRDGYIVKINGNSGLLKYGSFFGGENLANGMLGHDIINDIAINSQNELYIVGFNNTDATNNFPYTMLNGAYFQSTPIGHGGFIARFSSQGFQLDWCTRFSGNSNGESILKIAVSNNDLIAVAGRTESSTSFIPVFSGTVQNLTPHGGADWYVAVFDPSGALSWGTYEGSTDYDGKGSCDLTFDNNKSLYFGANIFSTNGIYFIQPGGAYFNVTNSGPSNPGSYFFNYGMLVHYRPDVYAPTWRTLVMDGVSMNKLNSLEFKDDKLFVSGTTNDGTMPLVSNSSDLYSGAKTTGGFGSNLEGYLMIFSGDNQSLMHSSYFGGHRDDNQEAFVMNDYAEIFGFGYSKSRYSANYDGIPVKNNGVPGAWYNDGEDYLPANSGYIFKWCAADTPLSIDEDVNLNTNQAFRIFPNPAVSGSQVSIKTEGKVIDGLRIVDISGRTLYSQSENLSNNTNSTRIHLPKLAPGIYLVILKINGNEISEKLVITD